MFDANDILISVKGNFAESIVVGTKTVEIRRRAPRLLRGTRVWLYSKSPIAEVVAICVLREIDTAPCEQIWQRYADKMDIARDYFLSYLWGASTASALILSDVQELESPVSLNELRLIEAGFHPPQFYMRLEQKSPVLHRLNSEIIWPKERLRA